MMDFDDFRDGCETLWCISKFLVPLAFLGLSAVALVALFIAALVKIVFFL